MFAEATSGAKAPFVVESDGGAEARPFKAGIIQGSWAVELQVPPLRVQRAKALVEVARWEGSAVWPDYNRARCFALHSQSADSSV